MGGLEWDAYVHVTMHSGSIAEETAISGGGGERVHHQVLQSLWDPPGYGYLLKITRGGDIGD